MSGITPTPAAFGDSELSKLKSLDPNESVPAVVAHYLVDEIRRQRKEIKFMSDAFNHASREQAMLVRELQETIAKLRGTR